MDEQWRKKKYNLDTLKKDYNEHKKKIGEKKKANKDDPCTELLEEKAKMEAHIEAEEKSVNELEK